MKYLRLLVYVDTIYIMSICLLCMTPSASWSRDQHFSVLLQAVQVHDLSPARAHAVATRNVTASKKVPGYKAVPWTQKTLRMRLFMVFVVRCHNSKLCPPIVSRTFLTDKLKVMFLVAMWDPLTIPVNTFLGISLGCRLAHLHLCIFQLV